MNYILFDGPSRNNLLPFTYTRPVADIRVGILTIREKWEMYLKSTTTTVTEDYLTDKYPMVEMPHNVMINASFLPNSVMVELVKNLSEKQALCKGEDVIAFSTEDTQKEIDFNSYEIIQFDNEAIEINHTWDIFSKNDLALKEDFELLTRGRESLPIPNSVNVIGKDHIFIEEGASIEFSILNASSGPIYIGKNSEIMEGCLIRGPFALCDNAVVKMGAKIYGATTLGPYCKVGGEVNNVVFTGYSNKGHDGFLGNSVIGEWCNLGADTNSSNMKNNYSEVKLWNYAQERFEKTGLQFCGLIMADHSKCGINTMFNTGTVVGVSANVYGGGYPRNFIPSFSWGGDQKYTTYTLEKALDTARAMMKRRDQELTEIDQEILKEIFMKDRSYRTWEKAILQ